MIKFFSQLRQSLVMENKTSKYLKYAIGEIVLVVIGILIALQINNWNERRKDKKTEVVILNQFLKDFQANDSIIKKGLADYQAQLKYIDVMLRHSGPNTIVPKDYKTADSIGRFTYAKIDLVYGSLDFSTQQIDRLNNEPLKLALSVFPSIYSRYRALENQVIILTMSQRKAHQKHVTLLARVRGFEKQRFKSDTLGWLRDRELQNITTDKKWITNGTIREVNKLNTQNQNILDMIKIELNLENDD